MQLSASEKVEIIHFVDDSEPGMNKTLRGLGIHKGTFYKWYRAYLNKGAELFIFGLKDETSFHLDK